MGILSPIGLAPDSDFDADLDAARLERALAQLPWPKGATVEEFGLSWVVSLHGAPIATIHHNRAIGRWVMSADTMCGHDLDLWDCMVRAAKVISALARCERTKAARDAVLGAAS